MRGEVAKRGGDDAGTSATTRDKEIDRNPHLPEGLGRDGPISLLLLLADVLGIDSSSRLDLGSVALSTNVTVFMKGSTKAIVTTLLVGLIACCIWLNVESWNSGDLMAVENTAEHPNAVFRVTGMTCDGCEAAVKMAVRQLDGIYQVDASYKEGSAVVSYEPSKVKPEEIKAAIEEIGYKAELQSEKGQPR